MHRTFTTPEPVSLYVELRTGHLVIHTDDVTETVVDVTGEGADEDGADSVEQRGDSLAVVALQGRHGFFGSALRRLSVQLTVPHDSTLVAKLGSADVRVEGRLGETTVQSGSGDVRVEELAGDATIATGSGDVHVDTVGGSLQVKCGSGDVALDELDGPVQVSTGSGDVVITTARRSVSVKSGSGDMRVREALGDVLLSTASGDLVVDVMHKGQLAAKNVSGDITVGIPAGVPVWTDVSSTTGTIRSTLQANGAPDEDQDYIELRARTISGDVHLQQI
jgi:DUF4097 and DUF4098 domain-containing protein YvlB